MKAREVLYLAKTLAQSYCAMCEETWTLICHSENVLGWGGNIFFASAN